MKTYWKTKDGRKIDIDTWDDLQHMRSVIKFLINQQDKYDSMDVGDYQDTF